MLSNFYQYVIAVLPAPRTFQLTEFLKTASRKDFKRRAARNPYPICVSGRAACVKKFLIVASEFSKKNLATIDLPTVQKSSNSIQ